MESAGSGGRYRLGRLGMSLLLILPLLGVTAAAGPGSAEPGTRTRRTPRRPGSPTPVPDTAVSAASPPPPPAPPCSAWARPYDTQPSAVEDQLVFASRRDEKNPQIYLRATDGTVRRLTTGMDAAHPQLTPDGESVVFDAGEGRSATCGW
ncbi:hypothetical protein SHKM778_11200 [Streptomyces sp. KM77-8]|uniref:S9 family peptidase n=1 Tax=Streptomyces haneummycinicus TaxID=3074435 RepID=A0AAT9HBG2_9ACTN